MHALAIIASLEGFALSVQNGYRLTWTVYSHGNTCMVYWTKHDAPLGRSIHTERTYGLFLWRFLHGTKLWRMG